MRLATVGCVAMLTLALAASKSQAQFEVIGALVVGKALDDFADRLDRAVAQATANGDYLIEKNGRVLQAVVRDTGIQLEQVLDKKVNDLKVEYRNFLGTLNTLIEELKESPRRILELQDFLALDLENIVRQMPGRIALFGVTSNKLSFRRLHGYSQVYQKDGVYTFRVVGAAFGPDFRSRVSVNGTKVKLFDMRTPGIYILEFDLPVEALNKSFSDEKTKRVDIQIESFAEGKEKSVFSYKNKILLLPKTPVSLKVVERHKVKEWSKEIFWSEEGSAAIARTGKGAKGEEPSNYGTVSATIPLGCLMLKETVTTRVEPNIAWGRWLPETHFSNEDRTVTKTFKHWIHDQDRKIYMKVAYRKPEIVTKDRQITIGQSGRIPFGASLADLSADYQSFTVEGKWFNGREFTLTPGQFSRPGIKVDLGTPSSPRLRIDLAWPEFANKP